MTTRSTDDRQAPLVALQTATVADLDRLLDLIRAYHDFEGIAHSRGRMSDAIRPLLGNSELGRIWLITLDDQIIGYTALCFGYSIEFAGRDAFVDELFVVSEQRGRGIGRQVLELIRTEARQLDVKALHLEVARDNHQAQRLYRAVGFTARDKYLLMTESISDDAV